MRIIFAGTPDFAVPSLRSLLQSKHALCAVYTQPDRPAGRGRKLQAGSIKQLAVLDDISVFQPINFKSDADLKQLKDLQPDLMVVVAYGMILPQAVLDIPRLGCINVHASLLPRWRGAAPIQRAILAGDDKSGVTIMRIVQKLDAGDMLHKEECSINQTDTAADLHDRLAQLGAVGLAKVLVQIENGTVKPVPQDENQVTYADKLTKAEANLDWSQSAEQLARKVRGLNPWPVAQTLYQGEILRIWQAQAVQAKEKVLPGTVTADNLNFDVATGNGVLRLLEIQLPGGKRLPSQDFLNAHHPHGAMLG